MATTAQICTEASIKRTQPPRGRAGDRWRWDVVYYREAEGTIPGVLDGRDHLRAECGYTRTFLGACAAVCRLIRRD